MDDCCGGVALPLPLYFNVKQLYKRQKFSRHIFHVKCGKTCVTEITEMSIDFRENRKRIMDWPEY